MEISAFFWLFAIQLTTLLFRSEWDKQIQSGISLKKEEILKYTNNVSSSYCTAISLLCFLLDFCGHFGSLQNDPDKILLHEVEEQLEE